MAGIQFFGVDSVTDAFADYEVDCWAIVETRDVIKTGCGDDELRTYLNKLQPQGSAATYTLRIYRGADDPDKITAKTEYSACFKFKLNEGGAVGSMGTTRYGGVDPLTARLQSVVAEEVGKVLDKKLGRDDDDEKPNGLSDAIMGLVNQPDKLIQVLQGIQGMFAPRDVVGHPATQYAAVAGGQPRRAGTVAIDQNPTQHPVQPKPEGYKEPAPVQPALSDNEETIERVAAVLDRLEKADPDILAHLEQLADLAEKKPETYRMGIKMLS